MDEVSNGPRSGRAELLVQVGSILVILGMLIFAVTVFRNAPG